MRVVSPTASSKSATFSVRHSSVDASVESSDECNLEIPTNDGMTEKNVGARFFEPLTYRHQEAWLVSFRVERVQNLLRIVSQKHESDILESVEAKRYRLVAELLAAVTPASV